MKLLATFFLNTFGVVLDPLPNPNACFAPDVDIDGSVGRTNVISTISKGVYSAAACQIHCKHRERHGCKYFVWEESTFSCSMYSGLGGLEMDADEDEKKWMGPVTGCLQCHREGWDYVVSTAPGNNLSGRNGVYSVTSVYKCAQLCKYSDNCYHVSYNKEDEICYLQTADAEEGIKHSRKYQTATKSCSSPSCVKENRKYANGWVTKYDVIGSGLTAGIPGVTSAISCQKMCQNVKDCEFWTYDTDDVECFLVKTADNLEDSADKISGSRSCI